MTIVEATFVFPIVFIIVFFMIMAGEAYYQRARVEHAVTAAAIDGAARCENPMLGTVMADGAVPTDPAATDVMPYRYIFTGEARSIANQVRRDLQKTLEDMQPLLFRNMSPKNVMVTTDLHMNPLVSSLPLECTFEIPLPIKMIFSDEQFGFRYSVQVTASIGDPAEFVRNVGMVADFLQRSQTAMKVIGGFRSAMEKVGAWTN